MRLTVRQILEERRDAFSLKLVAGESGIGNAINQPQISKLGLALTGYVDSLSPDNIYVLVRSEWQYIKQYHAGEIKLIFEQIFSKRIPCLILADNLELPSVLKRLAENYKVAILQTNHPFPVLFGMLSPYVDRCLAPRISLHGAMVDVYGVGLLFVGKSGVGKSECALDLVRRGHRLVADDLVEIKKQGNNILMASAPKLGTHFMEIRGIGIVDIERLYGIRAIRLQKRVEVIVELVFWTSIRENYARLGLDTHTTTILGVSIPKVVLPMAPGKNISTVAEVLAMNHMLKAYGYNAAREFTERVAKEIKRKSETGFYLDKDYE